MLFYSLNWSCKRRISSKHVNHITVLIQGLTSNGQNIIFEKIYDEWLAVCTNNIHKTISQIQYFFPGIEIRYEILKNREYKKVLPNFTDRLLLKKQLLHRSKNFFKLYSSNAYIFDIGVVLDKYKISYYRPEDWLLRLYIDLCLDDGTSFYYHWYNVGNSKMLLESMQLNLEYMENPAIHIVAFDLETVATDNEKRFAFGHDENDKIVTISLVKWNYRFKVVEKFLLYLNPLLNSVNCSLQRLPDVKYLEFFSEKELLETFYATINNCHILTGYSINKFCLPCLLARSVLLCMKDKLQMYSSERTGTHIVTTIQNKIILDMFDFIQTFSNQNLTGVQLNEVAQSKLHRSCLPIDITSSLHYYYHTDLVNTTDILVSCDKKYLYEYLKPKCSEFGTFSECLNACMENSVLIYLLFNHELALAFLIERANLCAINIQSALYMSKSKYILNVFLTTGIRLGYFINVHFFQNSVQKDLIKYREILVHRKNKPPTYQGGLNFGIPGTFFKNVTILDFFSMYSSIVVNQNLSYETSGLLELHTFLKLPDDIKKQCTVVPYSQHTEKEIFLAKQFHSSSYTFPEMDVKKHRFLMVSYKNEMGFLPSIMNEFLEKRKALQKQYKAKKEPILHVRQLNVKFLLNSISGCLGSENFDMAYVDIPMLITCYARNFLLGASHFVQHVLGCTTVYSDTDSIFVLQYDHENCDIINRYLNQKYMVLQFKKRVSSLLIVSKKRYLFREENHNNCKAVGFEKKTSFKWMPMYIAEKVIRALEHNERSASQGWIIWTKALIQVFAMCSNPKAYYVTPKICENNFIYPRADVSKWASEEKKISFPLYEDCPEINFEKLLINDQKKLILNLLNIAFFNLHDSAALIQPCNKVLNTMAWKRFLNAEFICLKKCKKPILILVLKSVKYSFEINQ